MKITVGVTTCNIDKYLSEFFDSLFNQTFKDFEVIVIDDNSTDNTLNIIKNYKENYSDKFYYLQTLKNLGSPSYTRNKILDSSKISGEYIIFLDGDDILEYDFLEKLFNNLTENNSDMSICGFERFDDKTKKVYSKEMVNFKYKYLEKKDFDDSLCFINVSLWNKLIRYSCIKDIRFKDVRGPEDSLFMIEAYQNINKISFVNDILIHYRVRYNSVVNASLDTVYKYGEFLKQEKELYKKQNNLDFDILVLFSFIHLGISLSYRLFLHRKTDMNKHILWTRKYFDDEFPSWRRLKYLSLIYQLKNNGIKGFGVCMCSFLYKINCFKLFLRIYSFVINTFKIDIKW